MGMKNNESEEPINDDSDVSKRNRAKKLLDLSFKKDNGDLSDESIHNRQFVMPSSSPTRHKLSIVLVVDLNLKSITYQHRQSLYECVKIFCNDMKAELNVVSYDELNCGVPTALETFYNGDAAVIDLTIQYQRNSLSYHLGVRESFSMKQNILTIADVIETVECLDQVKEKSQEGTRFRSPGNNPTIIPLSYESATQIKSTLPNFPLFVYSITSDGSQDENEASTRKCYVDPKFIDLSYSPGSDEQMDPSLPEFEDYLDDSSTDGNGLTPLTSSKPTFLSNSNKNSFFTKSTSQESDRALDLKGQLKEALKNLKWQAKAHMKEKFLADLRKVRTTYQGEELNKVLYKFKKRLEDPNILNTEVIYQMLVSYRDIQDYDSMIHLVDDLGKYSNLSKITSSPQIVFEHAFALNRRCHTGDRDRALKLMTTALENKEHQIPDSICLCGRIFKDRFIESSFNDQESLKHAINWYRKGFKISPNEYAAINLATLLFIAGHEFDTSIELRHIGLVLNKLIGKGAQIKLSAFFLT